MSISTRMYPEGRTAFYTRWVAGVLKFYKRSNGTEFYAIDGNTGDAAGTGIVKHLRTRVATADVNTGLTLLAAVAGKKYRVLEVKLIAIGGAAGGLTTLDITGVQATSTVKLVAAAQAGLTQNTVVRDGDSTGAVLAGGVSYVQNDVNTPIKISKTGASLTTATSVDVLITYALEV